MGTELRQSFGKALREAVNSDASRFDRNQNLKDTDDPLAAHTRTVLRGLCQPEN